MSSAQTLLNHFNNKKMEAFDFQKSMFEYYKQSDKTENIQKEILDIIRLLDKDETVRKDMWRVFFAPARDMHRKIDLLEVELLALKAYEDNVKEPHPILLKMSASLAMANCDRSSSGVYDQEKIQIWLNVFKDMPDFKINMEKEIKKSEEFEIKCKADYPDYFKDIEEKQNRPIVESYEIFVPVKARSNNPAVWTSKEMNILVNDIMNSFDDIGLYGYMDDFKNKCIHSRVEFQNGFIFTFDCYEKVDNLTSAKEDFSGQLSDGWGSNASQISILIGNEIVYLDWELDKIGDFVAKQPKNKNKPK